MTKRLATLSAEDIVKHGRLIETTNMRPDPWYGNNLVEIYLYKDRNYRVFRNDLEDASWWIWERVEPKQVTRIVWEVVE